MALATHNQLRTTGPIGGVYVGVTAVSEAPSATIDKVAIRNLLNQGNEEELIAQLKNAGNVELDLTEPKKSTNNQELDLERETTLGLAEKGVSTLVSLLKNKEVKLTKLALGYMPDCSPIFECLDSVTHLESLDVSKMINPKMDASTSGNLRPCHISTLADLFRNKLNEGSKFRELIVNAATYEDGFVQLANVNARLAETLNRYYGDRSLDKVIRFIDPESAARASTTQYFLTPRDACRYLLGFLEAGDAEGFKTALKCTLVYGEPSCAVTALDLTRLLAMLSRKGAATLGNALRDDSVQLQTVVLETVAETLEPILHALPFSNVKLLDLSKANLLVTNQDEALPECRYLGKQEFDQIRDLSTSSRPTTTQIRLDSWNLRWEDRKAWAEMKASKVLIDEMSQPPKSYVPRTNIAPSVAPDKAPIRRELNNVAVNSKIEDRSKPEAVKVVDPKPASSNIPAPLVFTDEKVACSYFHSLLEEGDTAKFKDAFKRASPAVTVLDLTSFGRLSETAVAVLGNVLRDPVIPLKELVLGVENQSIEPILQALPYSTLNMFSRVGN